jgi:hypothetical protein
MSALKTRKKCKKATEQVVCQHCEERPSCENAEGLKVCTRCYRHAGIRETYRRTATESAVWREWLLRCRRASERGVPLPFHESPRNVSRGVKP